MGDTQENWVNTISSKRQKKMLCNGCCTDLGPCFLCWKEFLEDLVIFSWYSKGDILQNENSLIKLTVSQKRGTSTWFSKLILCLLLLKNNHPKIIFMPKRHILRWPIQLSFRVELTGNTDGHFNTVGPRDHFHQNERCPETNRGLMRVGSRLKQII